VCVGNWISLPKHGEQGGREGAIKVDSLSRESSRGAREGLGGPQHFLSSLLLT
jgi:hypothetical protein